MSSVNGFTSAAGQYTPATGQQVQASQTQMPRFGGVFYFDETPAGETAEDRFISKTCNGHYGWDDAVEHDDATVAVHDAYTDKTYYVRDGMMGDHLKILKEITKDRDSGKLSEEAYAANVYLLTMAQPGAPDGVYCFSPDLFGRFGESLQESFVKDVCRGNIGKACADKPHAAFAFMDLVAQDGRTYFATGSALKALQEADKKFENDGMTLDEYRQLTHELAQRCEVKRKPEFEDDSPARRLSAATQSLLERLGPQLNAIANGRAGT